jgi:hypothetical protein
VAAGDGTSASPSATGSPERRSPVSLEQEVVDEEPVASRHLRAHAAAAVRDVTASEFGR